MVQKTTLHKRPNQGSNLMTVDLSQMVMYVETLLGLIKEECLVDKAKQTEMMFTITK